MNRGAGMSRSRTAGVEQLFYFRGAMCVGVVR
jgi:hypothetical protein